MCKTSTVKHQLAWKGGSYESAPVMGATIKPENICSVRPPGFIALGVLLFIPVAVDIH
jgi:hypothetical protein